MPKIVKKILNINNLSGAKENLLEFMKECMVNKGITSVEKKSSDEIAVLCHYEDLSGLNVGETDTMEYVINDYKFTGNPEEDFKKLMRLITDIAEWRDKGYEIQISKSGGEYGGISLVAIKEKRSSEEEIKKG